jgi:hypothetical protein
VFNNKSGAFLTHNPTFHDFSSQNTLLRIEIGRRLVDQVNGARAQRAAAHHQTGSRHRSQEAPRCEVA